MKKTTIYITLFVFGYSFSQNVTAFLPEIFNSYNNVRDIAISPNGSEIYFSLEDSTNIAFITKTKNGWSKPKTAAFSSNFRDIEPAFSPDGKKLFFSSNRPFNNTILSAKDYDIWYVEKNSTGWSQPKNIGAPINTKKHEFYPSITTEGDLYFTSIREEGKGGEDIFMSKFQDGTYNKPESLKGDINTEHDEFNAFISPDASILIFSSIRPNEGSGNGDLYISYSRQGKWTKGTLIKEINSNYLDFCPFIDFKKNVFYFTSQRTNVKDLGALKKGQNKIFYVDLKVVNIDNH